MRTSLFLIILLMGCAGFAQSLGVEELIQADRAFSRMSSEQGMAAAFLAYSASGAVKVNNGAMPMVGLDQIKEFFKENPFDDFQLTWQPERVKITIDETGNEQVLVGVYLTVWEKQPDGSWKYVVDGGGTTPEVFSWPE